MTTLDEKTKVSLWNVFALIPIVVLTIFWISMVSFRGEVTAEALTKLEAKQKDIDSVMNDVHDRVIRIEEKLTHKGCDK